MKTVQLLNKKVDRCVRLLEELNLQMRELRRRNVEQSRNHMGEKAETDIAEADTSRIDDKPERETEATANLKIESETNKPEPEMARGFNTDKFGRVYTEEEIQSIITD